MNDERLQPNDQTTPERSSGGVFGALEAALERVREYYHPIRKVCYEPLASHYELKYRLKYPKHHSKIFFFDMTLLFIIGALVVFEIFAKTILPLFPTAPLVELRLQGPTALVSGRTADFTYAYANDTQQTLDCAVLTVDLPAEAVVVAPLAGSEASQGARHCAPTASQTEDAARAPLSLAIGSIAPNGRGVVHFQAKFYAPNDGTETIAGKLSYWEVAHTAPTEVASRDAWQVADTDLKMTVDMPEGIIRGQGHAVTVRYSNEGTDVLPGASVRVAVPDDFVVTGWSPAPVGGIWSLGDLRPGAKGALTVNGYFRAATTAAATPTFSARGYVTVDGRPMLASLARRNADPMAGDLALTERVAPAAGTALYPGQTVTVHVRYQNVGTKPLTGLAITVVPGAAYVGAASPAGLSWTPTDTPALASVAPGASGELSATFAVNTVIDAQALGKDAAPALHVVARAEYAENDDAARPVRLDTAPVDLPIAGAIGLDAAAFYFTKDGDQLGVGPLPPKAGQTTKYRVFLNLTTTTSDVDGAALEATLPAGAEWTGAASVSAGDAIDYLPSTRHVRWNIGHIPAFATTEDARIGASFEVSITPAASAVGSTPPLLTGIRVTGTDAQTGLRLHADARDITTDLPFDNRAAGKGTVVAGDQPAKKKRK